MNKSWKLTAGLVAVFAVLCGAYFFSSPPASTPKENLDPRVLPDLSSDRVTKIEVDRKGTVLTFEKATDAVGEYWRMVGTTSHAADSALVQQMLFGLDRFLKPGALEPGTPQTSPETTGLNDPRLTVAFTAAGRREVLKFGKSPETNTTVAFYQHEGDPKIYTVSVDTVEAFNKPVFQYRAKTLVRIPPHRVNRIALEYRFDVVNKDKSLRVEYEKSVLEKFEEGMERGWYLTSPHKERMNDHAIAALVAELCSLPAGEYQPPGDPKIQGFDQPQVRLQLTAAGDEKPVEIQFGATTDRERKRWVRVPNSGEVALYDSFRYDELGLERKKLRNRVLFAFSSELVKRMEVSDVKAGKVVIERREVKKEGEAVATVKWEVTEPRDLRVESERLEAFVSAVVQQQIVDFYGAQDFKQSGLDPAPVRLTVETKEGKQHVLGFTPAGLMRREGVDEIFLVRDDFVRMLQRLELNFLNFELFNVPRDSLTEFSFESKASAELQPVYYTLRLDPKAKAWSFVDPAHQGQEADPAKVADLLAPMNYIKAEAMLAKDEATAAKYGLAPQTAPARLKIVHAGGTAELYISENKSDKVNRPLYYARFSDSPIVFQINGLFVDSLKKVPVK